MASRVDAIGPDFYRVVTESSGIEREYRVVIEKQREFEDGELVERGEAVVTKRTTYQDGDVEEEEDVSATDAVKELMDERGFDVS